jgi:putative membrane protein
VPDWLDPGALALIGVVTALYVRAVRVLGRRGVAVPLSQQAAWYGGVTLWAAALLPPVDTLSQDLLSAHMAQHLLLAELGAPLLLVGLRAPVIFFYLPRPAMVALARKRRLRRAMGALTNPVVAIAIYLVVLYAWHFAPLFEGATRHDGLHALQHQSFIAISILVWIPALEPTRRRLRGELWKAGHIIGARMVGMFLGMAFIAMRSPAYQYYADRAPKHGLTALHDQQIAGGLMVSLDVAIVLFAVAFFFWRSAQDHDLAEAEERARAQPDAAGPVRAQADAGAPVRALDAR